jgi:hypothetical protein
VQQKLDNKTNGMVASCPGVDCSFSYYPTMVLGFGFVFCRAGIIVRDDRKYYTFPNIGSTWFLCFNEYMLGYPWRNI